MHRRYVLGVAAAILVASFAGVAPTQAAGSCASTSHAGGDWAQHGGDQQATRNQTAESTISTENVGGLAFDWGIAMNSPAIGGAGNIQTTPVVAEGCVYVLTSSGGFWVVALNADTGELVWKRQLGSGGCHNAPVVSDGVIYINEPTNFASTGKGPHVLALDAATGAELYSGPQVATEAGTGANAGCAAPLALLGDYIVIGITNPENDGSRTGGYAVVDRATGGDNFMKRVHIVPDEQAAKGFGGCSLWSPWSVDPDSKHAYTGTAQPSSWTGKESERCNALIKIDLDPASQTFGEIVGAMKGTPDDPPYIDVDFGAGPTLVRDADGRQILGMLQKSGWFHTAYTKHMTEAWSRPVSPLGILLGNHTASASDPKTNTIYTLGGYPGNLVAFDATTGLPRWVSAAVSPIATNAIAVANGVLYYGDEKGALNAYDASTGVLLFTRPLIADVEGCRRNQSGGVSVARNRIYMACGPVLATYAL